MNQGEYSRWLAGDIRSDESARLLQHGLDHNDVRSADVIQQFGSWVVTKYGMESLTFYYPIKEARLSDVDWPTHMSKKHWVNPGDFLPCLDAARSYHSKHKVRHLRGSGRPVTYGLRFNIMKRDGYHCQICGRTADDGVKLEVDHKTPRAKGGKTTPGNLWTLCFPCNRGKKDKDL